MDKKRYWQPEQKGEEQKQFKNKEGSWITESSGNTSVTMEIIKMDVTTTAGALRDILLWMGE